MGISLSSEDKRLDDVLLEAIRTYEGVPTFKTLSKILSSRRPLKSHIDSNPKIREAMERRGKEWLHSLSDEEFVEKYSQKGWFVNLPQYAKDISDKRMDSLILASISAFDGIPSATALSKLPSMPNQSTINRRINNNPAIPEAMKRKVPEWLASLDDNEFQTRLQKKELRLRGLPDHAKEPVFQKTDPILLAMIAEFDGVPNGENLSKLPHPFSPGFVRKRIQNNPGIPEAMESRGRQWLDSISDEYLLTHYAIGGWFGGLPDYARTIVDKRINSMILNAIPLLDVVPNASALSQLPSMPDDYSIRKRISTNPAIQEAIERRGREVLDAIDDETLIRNYSIQNYFKALPEYAKETVSKRIGDIIMQAIRGLDGKPNYHRLSKLPGLQMAPGSIRIFIEKNPALWQAFYEKRGLTPDQAVELALEREDKSDAFKQTLADRLRHLSAYREFVGLLKCFGDLMHKSVTCISLYPEPLRNAAGELGIPVNASEVSMAGFKREAPDVLGAETVILHSIHRLKERALNRLFLKILGLHEQNPDLNVVATYATTHEATDAFMQALSENGFQLEEKGMVRLSPPSTEVLVSHGIAIEDVDRMRRKVKGEFNVMVLSLTGERSTTIIPALHKAPTTNGAALVPPEAERIDVPEGLSRELNAKFLTAEMVLPSEPFIVELCQEGERVALVGYDMDPERRNRIETASYTAAPAEDYRKIARRMAVDLGYRAKLGVVSGKENRIPLEKCKTGSK